MSSVNNNSKRCRNKNAHFQVHPTCTINSATTQSCRYDSSLGLLTKKFIDLLRTSTHSDLDLNCAAAQLKVQKRRIYDITNVLEGICLIEKNSKNHVRWIGNSLGTSSTYPLGDDAYDRVELDKLEQRLTNLKSRNHMLQKEHNRLLHISQQVDYDIEDVYHQQQHTDYRYLKMENIDHFDPLLSKQQQQTHLITHLPCNDVASELSDMISPYYKSPKISHTSRSRVLQSSKAHPYLSTVLENKKYRKQLYY
ncbi:E2F/DP family winged-helix DNA-binding domain-containing protein [Spinellus fusiger]|nr:E2F/DP family winged-helix DNA-binding domain-containing protein [Spinellus fusiger]